MHYEKIPDQTCPDCGSINFVRDESNIIIGLGAFFILGFSQGLAPWMCGEEELLCLDCGYRCWREKR